MANWQNLKTAVNNVIKTNGNQQITGQALQNVLNNIISSLGANAQFAGVATPETAPGTPDGQVLYLAGQAGVYSNFSQTTLENGEVAALMWNGSSWTKKTVSKPYVNDLITGGADKALSAEVGKEITSRLRVIEIEGKGDQRVIFVSKGLIGGHVYRLSLSNPNPDLSGITSPDSYEMFTISTIDKNGNKSVHERVLLSAGVLNEYYEFGVPYIEGPHTMELGVRISEGEVLHCTLEDITYSSITTYGNEYVLEKSPEVIDTIDFGGQYADISILVDFKIPSNSAEYSPLFKLLGTSFNNEAKATGSSFYGMFSYIIGAHQYDSHRFDNCVRLGIFKNGENVSMIVNGKTYEGGTTSMGAVVGIQFISKAWYKAIKVIPYCIDANDRLPFLNEITTNGRATKYLVNITQENNFQNSGISKVNYNMFSVIPRRYSNISDVPDFVLGGLNTNEATGGSYVVTTTVAVTGNLIPLKKGQSVSLKNAEIQGLKVHEYVFKDGTWEFDSVVNNDYKDQFNYIATRDLCIRFQCRYYDKRTIGEVEMKDISSSIHISKDANLGNTVWMSGDLSIVDTPSWTGKSGQELISSKKEEVYAMYDELLAEYSDVMSKTLLGYGTSEDGTEDATLPIYEYTITPIHRELMGNQSELEFPKVYKKILLTSGVHGREKCAVQALYMFVKSLLQGDNETYVTLLSNYEFKVIPLVVPNSYDDHTRLNKRGVNLARNLGFNWENQQAHDVTDKGSAPYSELESQIFRDWVLANNDAILYLDCHDSASEFSRGFTSTYCYSPNVELINLYTSFARILSNKIIKDLGKERKVYSYVAQDQFASTFMEAYAIAGIDYSSVVEVNNYFPDNRGQYNEYAISIHIWQVTNWIITLVKYITKFG